MKIPVGLVNKINARLEAEASKPQEGDVEMINTKEPEEESKSKENEEKVILNSEQIKVFCTAQLKFLAEELPENEEGFAQLKATIDTLLKAI
jgi:hypothetical protein